MKYYHLLIIVSAFLLSTNGKAQTTSDDFLLDTKSPVVTFTSPNSGTYTVNENILVYWNATDDNIASYGVTIGIWDEDIQHFFPLKDNEPNDGHASVSLTQPVTNGKLRVIVRDEFGNAGIGESNGLISVNGGFVLSGFVKDANTNQPIEGVMVSASLQRSGHYAVSNANGYYEIENLCAGQYNVTAMKEGYTSDSKMLTLNSSQSTNFFLTGSSGGGNSIVINEFLTLYADNIEEISSNNFEATGNVNINGIMGFTGMVSIDKRDHLDSPVISGNGNYMALDIQGSDKILKSLPIPYSFDCEENTLKPSSFEYLNGLEFKAGGFNVSVGTLGIDPEGEFMSVGFLLEMNENIIAKIQKKFKDDHGGYELFFETFGGAKLYHKTEGTGIEVDIQGVNANFLAFKISDFDLYLNTTTHIFEGGITISIPGITSITNGKDDWIDGVTPVICVNEMGDTLCTTTFNEIENLRKALGFKFLEVRAEVGFISGALEHILISVSTKIPIASTGLYFSRMQASVSGFHSKNWVIGGEVDIDAGPSLPHNGKPVLQVSHLGTTIKPDSYFEGEGTFCILGHDACTGSILYDRPKQLLKGGITMEMSSTRFEIAGETSMSIKNSGFSAYGLCGVQLKKFKGYLSLINEVPFLIETNFENKEIDFTVSLEELGSLSCNIAYIKTKFPYFKISAGLNLQNCDLSFKGKDLDGKTIQQFIVPENSAQLLVICQGENSLIDFELLNPNGMQFDSLHTRYYHIENELQTSILIENPTEGIWEFSSEIEPDTVFYGSYTQTPSIDFSAPQQKGTKSEFIQLSINDYQDTVNVSVYYDTDQTGYDGRLIQSFRVVNNATLEFEWKNDSLPNGEYYIYSILDDGNNTPVKQYSPGSINITNDPYTEIPQNVLISQQNDSIKVSWDPSIQPYTIGTKVIYKSKSDFFPNQVVETDTNYCYIVDAQVGREYILTTHFTNILGNEGPAGSTDTIILTSSSKNNPPYFCLPPDSSFIFIENEFAEYQLQANDADQDPLSFEILNDTLGMQITGNTLSWTPEADEIGFYAFDITVSDGSASDTINQSFIVFSENQMKVELDFNSVNLYENDNMFVKLRNYKEPQNNFNINITNINTGTNENVSMRRVNDFDFIGSFELSFINKSAIPVHNGDTIMASYTFADSLYTAYAYYDSLPQPTDITPPAIINDFVVEKLNANRIMLRWTGTGNDGTEGTPYRYDFRYHFDSIADADDYLVSHLYPVFHAPAAAGDPDSLIIDLAQLDSTQLFNKIWWGIVAEDEMYNRSPYTSTDGYEYHMVPYNVEATILDELSVELNWEGPIPESTKDTIGFNGYRVLRQKNDDAFKAVSATLDTTLFSEVLFDMENAMYIYGVQGVYSDGFSDTIFADPVEMGYYTPVNVLVESADSLLNNDITFTLNSLDSLNPHTYSRVTPASGVLLFKDVVKGDYAVEIAKPYYVAIKDTITASVNSNEFYWQLMPNVMFLQDSVYVSADTNQVVTRTVSLVNYSDEDIDYILSTTASDTWINIQTMQGSVAANDTVDIDVEIHTSGLNSGIVYFGILGSSFDAAVSPDRNLLITLETFSRHSIALNSGWSGISSFLNPVEEDMVTIFEPAFNDLIIVKNINSVYWPPYANSLGSWDMDDAYKVKMDADQEIEIRGISRNDLHVPLNQGWNHLPCSTADTILASSVLSPLGSNLVIVKDMIGGRVYWPGVGVYTLENLAPGEGYMCNVEDPDTVNFALATIAGGSGTKATKFIEPLYFDAPVVSAQTHIVAFPETVTQQWQAGDRIAAFNTAGDCVGLTAIPETGVGVSMALYGNDETEEQPHGLSVNEPWSLQLYRPGTKELFDIEAGYETGKYSSASYITNGLSVVSEAILKSVSIPDGFNMESIKVYPNPASDQLAIFVPNSLSDQLHVLITDMHGKNYMKTELLSGKSTINISQLPPGVYMLQLQYKENVHVRRIVIQRNK